MKMENQICSPNTPLPPPLSMHKSSQTISKSKPKIRIIHIFAPEIIKTDAANFRELVQRLTGKPTDGDLVIRKGGKVSRKKEGRAFSSNKIAMRAGFSAGYRERIKGEEEIWSSANSGGGFLDQFDGFMQEINGEFPFIEGTTDQMEVAQAAHLFPFVEGTTPMDVYGGGQIA